MFCLSQYSVMVVPLTSSITKHGRPVFVARVSSNLAMLVRVAQSIIVAEVFSTATGV